MTTFGGPFDTGNMAQAQWEEVESKLWADGVITGARNQFAVTTTSGLGLSVNTGDAVLDGFRFYADSATALTCAAADPSLPRIDLVVLRLDEGAKTATIAIKTGTPASSPSAPSATKTTGGTYELGLAQARVNAGSATINTLTDVRTYTTPAKHASAHASGGSDPITPAAIGAMPTSGGNFSGAITVSGATVWTSANDGTGSGLDADLLDGQNSTAFLGASATAADSSKLGGALPATYVQVGSHNSISPLKISAGTVLPGTLDSREIFILLA